MDVYKYFQSFEDFFWQWEEDEEVIAVPNSGTIAYRQTILQILSVLRMNGFPPFSSLVLVLAYTSSSKFISHTQIEHLLKQADKSTNPELINEVLKFMAVLKSLEPQYHSGEMRLVLFTTIFKNCHNRISEKKSNHILKVFNNKEKVRGFLSRKKTLGSTDVYNIIRPLALLSKKFPDAESIKSAMAGGSDVMVEDIEELELDELLVEEDLSNDLVSQLKQNLQTFKSGALIKRIWSSANIPMHLKIPSGQPFGGVADITNKGEFDKLLISEYANEDFTFLSRLANKEAMYFNREAPPSDNNEERIIILDVSLKNWGTTKIVAFALMLSIAHHPKAKNTCACYAVGRRAYKLSIQNMDEIIESVQILDTSISAASGLKELFSERDFSNNEVFFISEKSSSNTPEISNLLNEYNHPIDYWMHPDGLGNIDIFKKYRSGRKHHQSFRLPLNELWARKKRSATFKTPKSKTPNIEEVNLLVADPTNKRQVLISGDDLFVITPDGQLLRKRNGKSGKATKGWEVLHKNITYVHGSHAIGRNKNGQFVLLSLQINENRLRLLNISTNEIIERHFDQHRNSRWKFFIYHNSFFHLSSNSSHIQMDMTGEFVKKVDEGQRIKKEALKYIRVIEELKRKMIFKVQVLKRIHKVSLKVNSLVLNDHVMFINSKKELKIKQKTSQAQKYDILAKRVEENTYAFAEGSLVKVLKCGILLLESSNKAIPTIQLLSIIDEPIAVSAEGYFAGNKKYFKESSLLWKIYNTPNIANTNLDDISIEYYESGLDLKKEKQYTYVQVDEFKEQEVIPIQDFYMKYIYKFLSEISRHGPRS